MASATRRLFRHVSRGVMMNKTMIFKFKSGAHIHGDAQVIGEQLEAIRAKHDGLTPAAVVSEARKAGSILHPYFEWDDKKAAAEYRNDQASHLIRSIDVVISEPECDKQSATRAFVSVQKPTGERVYEALVTAMSDSEYRRQVLEQAHRELAQLKSKYSELQELSEVFSAVDRVEELLQETAAV